MLPVPPPPPPAGPRFLYPTSTSSLCRPSPPPISATSTTAPAPLTSLEFRRYDFAPLLEFLSSSSSSASAASAVPPAQLDPAELRLAESYRAVPAHLWHALLKSLASSPSTLPSAAALVPWLVRHRLCFSSDLLYSILIHALGRSRRLHHALLLSTSAPGPPSALTFNALISASAINGRPGQALHLLSLMRRHGFLSDHPNYTLVLQSLLRCPPPPPPPPRTPPSSSASSPTSYPSALSPMPASSLTSSSPSPAPANPTVPSPSSPPPRPRDSLPRPPPSSPSSPPLAPPVASPRPRPSSLSSTPPPSSSPEPAPTTPSSRVTSRSEL